MKINLYGLGYVGCVSAACLANDGHTVTAFDPDRSKVSLLNDSKSPIVEPGLQEAIQAAVIRKKLTASLKEAPSAAVSIVCVGTPSNENGSPRLEYIERVANQIGEFLKSFDSYHVVNIRSTVLPGTISEVVIPILEKRSHKKAGRQFGVCMNPEFMREGSSLHDYYNPPFTLIGEIDRKSGEIIGELYGNIRAPIIPTSIAVAEMVKYTCNAFHGLKVAFANEIGNFCKRVGIDSHLVMDIVCQDTKLNISPTYLRPGFAFGGSCLPKDLRAVLYKAKSLDLNLPLLESILVSNKEQLEAAFSLIRKTGRKKIGFLGLSFKAGTDDLRESPTVELIEKLLGKGYDVTIHDREVSPAKISGSNRRYIEDTIPHVSSLMKDTVAEIVEGSDVLVLASRCADYKETISRLGGDKFLIDLVRVGDDGQKRNAFYEGLCW